MHLFVGFWMIFVGYRNVGQTIESKTDKGFLRYKQYPLFVLRKVNSHRKWFSLYYLSAERHCFRKLRLKRRKYICKVVLIRRQQTISNRAPTLQNISGSEHTVDTARSWGKKQAPKAGGCASDQMLNKLKIS